MGLDMAQNGMSGFKSEAIPVYTSLAEEFVVFDQWFAFVRSSMQPNCLFIHSASERTWPQECVARRGGRGQGLGRRGGTGGRVASRIDELNIN
jgi:hypothetical protein